MHLQDFLATPKTWANPQLIEKWRRVRDLRRVVTGALEIARADKKIGSSLEATPFIILENESDAEILASIPFEEIVTNFGRGNRGGGNGRRQRFFPPRCTGRQGALCPRQGRQMRTLLARAAGSEGP